MGIRNFVQQQDNMAQQMSLARSTAKPDDANYDPDSNVYVANLPSDFGKDRLYELFSKYGQIVRYKFVTPDETSQPGYGFVQFANRKDAHLAIKNLEGHQFATGEAIYLSIALRRRSSLSDELTNLYVKNLPTTWTNEKLRSVFGAYGQIRQSKVVGDGIAFVRFEDHEQALNAIGRLDKQMVEQGCKLEVRFATRKTAANAYRLQQVPQSKSNENNLYIRNLPKNFTQSSLEQLFVTYGKISSAKINDNGIAFVRFAHPEDAKRAIQELNGKRPRDFEEEIVVKLAHFDIGDSRNRWAQKFPPGAMNGGHLSQPFPPGNNTLYPNHFLPFNQYNQSPMNGSPMNPMGGHPHSNMSNMMSGHHPNGGIMNGHHPNGGMMNGHLNSPNSMHHSQRGNGGQRGNQVNQQMGGVSSNTGNLPMMNGINNGINNANINGIG